MHETGLTFKYTESAIQERVSEIAKQISRDYADRPLVLLSILKGSAFFLADLSRRLTVPHGFEFINVTRRQTGASESTEIDFSTPLSLEGKDVIVLKDVVNTGVIETYLSNQLRSDRPASIRFAAIIDKPRDRRSSVLVDYVLFSSTDNEVWVGYGMEHAGRHGNLGSIAVLGSAASGAEGQ
jgi:hypoxanthine phosphoribosyltransferase